MHNILGVITLKDIKEYVMPQKGGGAGGPLGMGRWGFLAPELAQMAYALFTVVVILFTWTNIKDPSALLWQRFSIISGTLALWLVYWLWPCKFVIGVRIAYLLAMLGLWYPDTFEINQQFGSYDHIFAQWEQNIFHCQPALLFCKHFSSAVVSELMYMGYVGYYLFFVVTIFIVYFKDYQRVERVTYMIMAGFFLCYVIFVLLPVTGPMYYYYAVGEDAIAAAQFPDIERYFSENVGCLKQPGWERGLFYHLCEIAHETGERPTAAFPSSHVGIATLVMCMVAKMRMWRYLLILAIPFAFLCLSTVYIQAHYAIDALAGLVTGVLLFVVLRGWKL